MAVIRAKNIKFSYGSKEVLDCINFTINSGEIAAVLGPNGCGKTTLLDCIMGFHKPSTGEIFVQGMDINSMSSREIAQNIAYIPQKTSPAFSFSVLEMAVSGRASHLGVFSTPGKSDYEIAFDALVKMGISHLCDRSFETLSGGESQLAIIARALCQDSDILIMDEPTAHLDFFNSYMVIDMIIHIVREFGKSVIISTHNPDEVFYMLRSGLNTGAVLIKDKSIFRSGPASEIMNGENLESLFGRKCRIVGSKENGFSLVPD